ncbi:MAG: hypothetical protein GF347_02755 [Candidatus Moranbacteria bacterium]|nr:hypothetical protein [Candidatus Moranbacteria bacterium]
MGKKLTNYTPEKTKKWIINLGKKLYGSDNQLKKISKVLEKHFSSDHTFSEKEGKTIYDLARTFNDQTGTALIESIDKDYECLAFRMKNKIEKEYNCKLLSEKALVDQIVNSYIRKLGYSKIMKLYDKPTSLCNEQVNLLKFYSMECDRCHRQFISGLETLRAIKQPSLKVNIKSNKAYISQNQQINNNEKINDPK